MQKLSIATILIVVIMPIHFASSAEPTTAKVRYSRSNEIEAIYSSGDNLSAILLYNNVKKNVKIQEMGMNLYTRRLTQSVNDFKLRDKYAINNFIVYGTPSTKKFSRFNRYMMIIKSRSALNNTLPTTKLHWGYVLDHSNDDKPESTRGNFLIFPLQSNINMTTGPVTVYRTKKDYSNNVSVGLKEGMIVSYPSSSDVIGQRPVKLEQGYYIKKMTGNAFLSVTIDVYSKAKKNNDYIKIKNVVDSDPFLEIYECSMVTSDKKTLNEIINNGGPGQWCEIIK